MDSDSHSEFFQKFLLFILEKGVGHPDLLRLICIFAGGKDDEWGNLEMLKSPLDSENFQIFSLPAYKFQFPSSRSPTDFLRICLRPPRPVTGAARVAQPVVCAPVVWPLAGSLPARSLPRINPCGYDGFRLGKIILDERME